MASSDKAKPLLAAEESPAAQLPGVSVPSRKGGVDLWKKARVKIIHAVRVKHKLINLHGLARDTALMRSLKTEAAKARYVLMIMSLIVILGAITAMTKSAIFHMKAVGRWDDGKPYKFSYALSLMLLVFMIKIMLVFVKIIYKDEEADDHDGGRATVEEETESDQDDTPATWWEWIVPWALLVSFTFFEMLSGTVASLGLLYGAPTSVFVVFKSSKTIFLAILSVLLLGRKLNAAQWSSLILISAALTMATVAEGKGGKKGGGLSVVGPLLLLLSELFHAAMLVLQEIAVKKYWPDPLALLSISSVFGFFMTLSAIIKASGVWVTLPDGNIRPAADPADALHMCIASPVLGFAMLFHLSAHVSSDVSHIVILKHISALARTLCDAVKLILMWLCGKTFWIFGIFPVLAEAWHPGFIGSWLMIPAIFIIIYGMLMFKEASFTPIKIVKQGGRWGVEEVKVKTTEKSEVGMKVNLEDPFYVSMFRSAKLKHMQRRRSMKTRSSGS